MSADERVKPSQTVRGERVSGKGVRMYDVVVVGGGPAGLAAATWLGRYRRHTLLVDSGTYRNHAVDAAHGFLGSDGINPAELRERAMRDLSAYESVECRPGIVRSVRGAEGDFTLDVDGDEIRALRLVLATGVRDAFPEVEDFETHYGASAFHCPTCDGYEARDRNVVALGWNEAAAGFALLLLDWAKSVTLVTGGRTFEGDIACREALTRHDIELVEDDAVRLEGERGNLRAVVLRTGRRLDCELFFFSVAHEPQADLASQLGCRLTGEGHVDVDDNCRTSVTGVYAAGDLTPGMQLIAVAAAKGTIAGVSAAFSLHGEPGSPESPPMAPDPAIELQSPQ
jgi:thioredoxin reductase